MTSAIGTGYDFSASSYSPDGRIFQVEYAQKAVENSSTAIGVCFKNGVVLGVEKEVTSTLYTKNMFHRIYHIDKHIGMAVSGLIADARNIVSYARKECTSYKEFYGVPISVKNLCDRIALLLHAYTTNSGARPFGCSVLLASTVDNIPQLFTVDPSGSSFGQYACAIGKDKLKASSLLERLDRKNILMDEGVVEVAKILHKIIDEPKPTTVEFELSFIGEFTNQEHIKVPEILQNRATREALGLQL